MREREYADECVCVLVCVSVCVCLCSWGTGTGGALVGKTKGTRKWVITTKDHCTIPAVSVK